VDAALRRLFRRFRERLDADTRQSPAARGVDQGFALSDHADWPGLIAAIHATGAERVYATHGSVGALTRYLRESGLDARDMRTEYGEEEAESGAAEPEDAT
jgi:putative mRNA 3-end processing factor